jgi:hypothetical protein
MVRREPQFGNQMDAAPAGNRKHRTQAERGSISPLEAHADVLLALIGEQPDLTLDEIVAAMRKRRIAGSRSAVWRFFERHNISFKKSLRAAEKERADVARARRRWMREQGMFDPARLVFIDETSTNTAMVRLRGRCPRGIRLIDHVPHGHWKTITFIAGLRRRAMVAPFVLDGPMNATSFIAHLKRCLAPTLKRGDIVMMDNLPMHKVAERFHMTRIRSSSPQCPFIEAKGDRTKLIHNGGALVHDVAYTSSHAPRALANRRVTGDPDLVAAGWFNQKFFPEPVDLALSLGCGFGGFERVMIAFGLAKRSTLSTYHRGQSRGRAQPPPQTP